MVGNQSATKAAKRYKKVQPFLNCYSSDGETGGGTAWHTNTYKRKRKSFSTIHTGTNHQHNSDFYLGTDISKKFARDAETAAYHACWATMAFTSFATCVILATPSSDNISKFHRAAGATSFMRSTSGGMRGGSKTLSSRAYE